MTDTERRSRPTLAWSSLRFMAPDLRLLMACPVRILTRKHAPTPSRTKSVRHDATNTVTLAELTARLDPERVAPCAP